jgi:hypothetical protein
MGSSHTWFQYLCMVHTAKRMRVQNLPLHAPRLLVSRSHRLHIKCCAPRLLVSRPQRLYITYAAHPVASARRAACRVTHRRLLRLRRASGCLGMSCGSSRGLSPTTSSRVGLSSTTSPTPRVRVPWHVAQLVTRLVADNFASHRLVVDYFAYAARPGASTCRAAHHTARPPLVVDYFDYTACPGASTCRAARPAARRRLLCLRRVSGCLGTSHDSSRGSSLTTSPCTASSSTTSPRAGASMTTLPTSCVRVPRHVARPVVDYFTYAVRPGALARHVARCVARRRLLRLRRVFGCLGSLRGSLSTTSLMLFDRVPRLLARLVVDLAPSLPLDFSSFGRTGSRRAPVTPSRGLATRRPVALAQLLMSCIRTRHLRRSTSRRLVALALAVRPVTPSCSSTTSCAAARFVVRSHWLYFSHAVRRDYLSRSNTDSTSSMPCTAVTSSSDRIAWTTHLD